MRPIMKIKIVLALFLLLLLPCATVVSAEHRIGGSATYWTSIDDIELDGGDTIDDDGLSFAVSYQYWPSIIGLEVDLEFLPDRFGENAVAPQVYALVGRSIYGGLGFGYTYSDGSFNNEPFFALRAGLNLELLPGIYGDIYGNYRFNDKEDLDGEDTDIDTDTVFLGVALRIAL